MGEERRDDIVVVGVPFDGNASFLRGPALAPPRIRDALASLSSNLWTENGIDLDYLDPAFAPGVSHYEPGGMSTREVLDIVQRLEGDLVGADIVEYNPDRDRHGMTAMVAAKLLKEILARMLV